jgi:hypothetical protein
MTALSPLLLIWCGLTATLSAAAAGMAFSARLAHAWAVTAASRSRRQALKWTIIAGVVVYPLLYGVIFELAGRADLRLGIYLGVGHALLAFAGARFAASAGRGALRSAIWHFVYATAIAFFYVTA